MNEGGPSMRQAAKQPGANVRKTRVLIAEDSMTTREHLVMILNAESDVEVVGTASNGKEAVEMTRNLVPNVVVMDISMPVMDGFDATRVIMSETPTPVIIMSAALDVQEVGVSRYALRSGAVCVMPKPAGPGAADFESQSRHFVGMVKSMGQSKVVRRGKVRAAEPAERGSRDVGHGRVEAVAIAASTGGPAALHHILSELPPNFPAALLVVQQIAPEFIDDLVGSLRMVSALRVKLATDGETILPRTVYIAPGGRHMGVSDERRIVLSDEPPSCDWRPSANHMFATVARSYGASAAAVVLTGKQSDGVSGLHAIQKAGGRVIAQDRSTSLAFGLPRAAQEAGVVDTVLPLPAIPAVLIAMTAGGAREAA